MFGCTATVSVNDAVVPPRTVLLGGLAVSVSRGSQVATGATGTANASIPTRIAVATSLATWLGMSTPEVPPVIAVACPSSSRPGPDVPVTGTATTRIPLARNEVTESASVWPRLGSLDRASPNHAMIRDPRGRYATAPFASWKCALMKSVCGLPPPPTLWSHRCAPATTASPSSVSGVLTRNARSPLTCSLYSATPKRAVGCAVRTSAMIAGRLLRTLASTGSMLPVVSARNTMSGFGATTGVVTFAPNVELAPVRGSARRCSGRPRPRPRPLAGLGRDTDRGERECRGEHGQSSDGHGGIGPLPKGFT